MNLAQIKPVLPFRVHFEDPSIAPLDVSAVDPEEAREIARERRQGALINKVKIVRERI